MPILALLSLLIPTADAAGYYFVDAGTRGMARGGAFIASTNDLSAQYYNPAALINLKRSQFYINHAMVTQDISFTRHDYLEDENGASTNDRAPAYDYEGNELAGGYPTTENTAPAMQIPQFAVGSSLGVKNAYFAFGLHPPYAPQFAYEKGIDSGGEPSGPQRYGLVDALMLQFSVGPSAAYRVLPWLTLGGSVNWVYVSADEGINVILCRDDPTTEPVRCNNNVSPDGRAYDNGSENDLAVSLTMTDPNIISWNAGVLVEPTDWLKIGLSALPPLNIEGKGSMTAQFSQDHWMGQDPTNVLENYTVTDNDVTVKLKMPWIFRGGVAVEPNDKWVVEFASVLQLWHVQKEIRVTDVNLNIDLVENLEVLGSEVPVGDVAITDDVVLPAEFDDAWSLRLGGEYEATDWLSLRGGGYYETSAIPTETQSVALVDGAKWGYGLGGTYFHKKESRRLFSLDLGFSQTFITERTITGSQVRRQELPINLTDILQGNELSANIVPGQSVGNGIFSSRITMMSAGATVYWGKSAKNKDEGKGKAKGKANGNAQAPSTAKTLTQG
jgi:long-chain fatty acid transport protein